MHDLLRRLAVPAARNARREQAALQAIIDAGAEPFPLEAHDWAFYTEKVRAAEYDLDRGALRPWFEAERVLQDGVFRAATDLYGITLHRARRPRRPTTPTRASSRCTTPTDPRSASSSSTCTRATPSAAAPG